MVTLGCGSVNVGKRGVRRWDSGNKQVCSDTSWLRYICTRKYRRT